MAEAGGVRKVDREIGRVHRQVGRGGIHTWRGLGER